MFYSNYCVIIAIAAMRIFKNATQKLAWDTDEIFRLTITHTSPKPPHRLQKLMPSRAGE